MKYFYHYLKLFFQEDFDAWSYVRVGTLLVVVIVVNYTLDLEDGIVDQIRSFWLRGLAFLGIFSGLYYGTYLLSGTITPFKNTRFVISSVIGLVVISVDMAFQPGTMLHSLPGEIRFYMAKVIRNWGSIITTVLPLMILAAYLKDQTDRRLLAQLGVARQGFKASPYAQLFAIVIPLVFAASFLEGFQNQYPMYKSTMAHHFWDVPEWLTVIGYEIAYGWNFITIEFLFRGFFVVFLSRIVGKEVLVPMVVIYCAIHFGKPLAECLSSILGGYILGVIAFYSRNIWGGIIIHLGLAWLMEIMSFVQVLLQ